MTSTVPRTVYQPPRPRLPSRLHNHNGLPSYSAVATEASHTPKVAQKRLTKVILVEHDLLYDDSETSFQTAVRIRELQDAGRKLGFDLPLHCYETDHRNPDDWIEEQALRTRQR
jgi:hypothetical protein